MKRRGLILLAAMAIVACTEEAAVTPTTNPTGATTSTTETIPDTTTVAATTSAPPATTPPDTATTVPETTIAPTTTVTAVGDPTSAPTEYFIGGDSDGWLYLGRWTGNDWESNRDDDQELREPSAASGDEVLIHELGIEPIDGAIDGSDEACSGGRTGPVISPNARAPQDPGFGFRSIAFPADWSTRPRPVALVDTTIDSYVAAGRAAFDDLEIDTESGSISQLAVSDLDGDGDTEAIVAFDGELFSALLLIDADTKTAITVARSVTTTVTPTTVPPTTVADGEDEPGTDAEAETEAAATPPPEPVTTPNETFRILAVVDLNGDGLAEIVMHRFEGDDAEVTVNAYDGTEVDPVLTAGC